MGALNTLVCLSMFSWEQQREGFTDAEQAHQRRTKSRKKGFMKNREEESGATMILLAHPGPEEDKMMTVRHIPLSRFPASTASAAIKLL